LLLASCFFFLLCSPSGAGKTSLLNILSGRKKASSGTVYVDNQISSSEGIFSVSAYVQQDDCILATSTVREAIVMSALLRLPQDMEHEKKLEKADEMIELFALTKCQDTYIGNPASNFIGVSGGERKRCAIAALCVTNPDILFLDEPTSGLDSFIAFTVLKILKRLNSQGVTVVTTLHQPSSDIFSLFDDLHLLVGGRTVYYGPSDDSVPYFAALGYPCPKHSNPADFFFMHVLTEGDESKKATFDQAQRTQALGNSWDDSKENAASTSCIKKSLTKDVFATNKGAMGNRSSNVAALKLLFKRSFNEATRNPMRVKAQCFQALAFSFIVGSIWFGLGNNQQSIQDRNGVLFFMSANGMMSSLMGVLSTFGNERETFTRDYENGLYAVGPYFLAKILCDAPFYTIFPLMSSSIMYWTVGFQNEFGKYFRSMILMILLNYCGSSLGLIIASIFSYIAVALMVAPLIMMPLMMFSGFFLNT
jgi:ABC-type multidrug transport system ATPase subunit